MKLEGIEIMKQQLSGKMHNGLYQEKIRQKKVVLSLILRVICIVNLKCSGSCSGIYSQ